MFDSCSSTRPIRQQCFHIFGSLANEHPTDDKVVFCTGGAGSICSAQVRALVYLGANAAIIGRNVEKTEQMAKDIATARKGAKVIGIGAVDVRKPELLQAAANRTVEELGSIDFVMWVATRRSYKANVTDGA